MEYGVARLFLAVVEAGRLVRERSLGLPDVGPLECAESAHLVVQHLGIEELHAVIGNSMGGMSGLAYCVANPGAVKAFVSISSCTRSLPFSIAVRSLQREMIRSDPKWLGGDYDSSDPPTTGQRLARKLGMMTYRSPQEWEQRFGRERVSDQGQTGDPFRVEFSVESYLQNHAEKFSGAFDANCYLYLSRASDLFDFAEHGGSLEAAFKRLQLERVLVIGVETDILFPIHQQQELGKHFSAVCEDTTLVELDCIKGHDSFLVDMDAFRPVLCEFFGT